MVNAKKLYLDISFSNCRTSKIKNFKKAKLEKLKNTRITFSFLPYMKEECRIKYLEYWEKKKSTNLDFCALQNYLPKSEAEILYQSWENYCLVDMPFKKYLKKFFREKENDASQTQNKQYNIEEEQSGRLTLPYFKTYCKATAIKNLYYWKNRQICRTEWKAQKQTRINTVNRSLTVEQR